MASIVTINTQVPTITSTLSYDSGESLQDYDIVVFDPVLPWRNRIDFSAGGSCIDIDGAQSIQKSMGHWSRELADALKQGKTVYFLLNEKETDQIAVSSTMERKGHRNYQTANISSYDVLPVSISSRNAKGHQLSVIDSRFKPLSDAIEGITEYEVIIESGVKKIFTTKNGKTTLGGLINLEKTSGNLVLLPYFSFSEMVESGKDGDDVWTKEALNISKTIVGQLISLDKVLRTEGVKTPEPSWIKSISLPQNVVNFDIKIQEIEKEIQKLNDEKVQILGNKTELIKFTALLYENGGILEKAIEESLRLLGYKVENYRNGDLEIDHIIIGPNGFRMIGESEGKDDSAINISKFRQLESNIGEDFERDDISEHAKGILFGNGYRFTDPSKRPVQFTDKCLANAKRLGTALIRTVDLYEVVRYILDHPEDETFKQSCRETVEETQGEIVKFPSIAE